MALRLRIYHLLQAPMGAETHSILVTDIPGVPRGLIFDRLSGPLLKLVPKKIKQSAASQLNSDKMDPESENPSSNVDEANPGGGSSEVKEMAKLSKWVPPDRWMEAKTAISSAGGVHNMVQDEFSEVYGKDEVSDVSEPLSVWMRHFRRRCRSIFPRNTVAEFLFLPFSLSLLAKRRRGIAFLDSMSFPAP